MRVGFLVEVSEKREGMLDGADGHLARYGKEQRLQFPWFTHRNKVYTLTKVGGNKPLVDD